MAKLETPQKEAVAEEGEMAATQEQDGTLRDFRGNPIPLKEDGTVNQQALWNNDPEAWAKWNDTQRQDGGANSRGYIAKAVKKLQGDAKAIQKQIAKELDFDKIEQLEGQLAGVNDRITQLNTIEANYAAAEAAQKAEAKAAEETAKAVEAPVEETPAPVAPVAEETPTQEEVQATPEQVEAARIQALKDRIKTWEERTGVKINALESREQVTNKQAAQAIDEGKPVTGWFEPNTGSVVIYLPNIIDEAEIDRTYMHEAVSHKGLKELLGDEGWNTLMDSVWNTLMTEKDKADYLAYNSHLKGSEEYLRRAAADEYVAHFAETVNAENAGAWQKFVEMVKEILLKLGMDVKITNEDLSNLLQASLANYERIQAERRAIDIAIGNSSPALSQEVALGLLANMEAMAEQDPNIVFSEEAWERQFPNNRVNTPIGQVKLGENQKTKLNKKKREGQFGLIKPTLENPDIILYKEDALPPAGAERVGKLLFIKTFIGEGGEKRINFESVTIRRDNLEISISSHIAERNVILKELQENNVVYTRKALLSNSSEGYLTEQNDSVPDLVPTQESNASSESKDSEISGETRTSEENNLTNAQKGAIDFVNGDGSVFRIARLDNNGIAANNDEVRFSVRYVPTSKEIESIAKDIAAQVRISKAEAKRWIKSETSLAAIITGDSAILDYEGDDRYKAIKQDSDYPQGTVDFNNICRKRLAFTNMYQRVQKAFPNTIITGEDLAAIRNIMKEHGLTVACGLCYVEDRRQLLGEIAKDFIDNVNSDFEIYVSRGGETKRKNAEKFRSLIGEDKKADLSIYDLITLDGSTRLQREHPGLYQAFQAFNNARGQQSGNLFQGYAEYKREILKWNKKKVKSVNDQGGLRIFSYSDFEAHHLIDLVQIIQDCARKGVKIQGYTKVPAFARAIAETGIKLNRSLIPLGDTGMVDGKLAYDPVEGIDVNDPDFLPSNDNVGNILIGINDEQIRLAMADPFVHYIIPYHSNQKDILRSLKQTGKWTNYKLSQNDRDASGKTVKNINIYTEVLDAAEKEGNPIKTDREFTEKFLAVCKEKGYTPRFAQFLDKNEAGEYVYTPGYYKFLLDFKLFDENGNLLPQEPVKAIFDDEFNAKILNDYVADEKAKYGENLDDVYNEIVDKLGLEKREPDVRFRKVNANQKQPVSEALEPVVTEEDAMFRLSKNNRQTVESWIGKREDLSDEQKGEVVDYIDKLDDAKTQLATAKWFANGTIRIPEDMKKVQQAISVAGKAKVDPLRYNSPMELLDAHADFKPSEERINPDEVSTLHRAAEYPEGIVVYDVDGTEESRKNMREIINTHYGKDASPWCLLQGDGKGNLTPDSKRYWKHYSAYPKQVAFKDGKLLAFSANDKKTRLWWDRKDESHYGIPVTQKIEGDELGRSASFIIEDGQLVKEPGSHLFKGNRQNGLYEEWSSDGNTIIERTSYKDGQEEGLTEAWYPNNGQMQRRTTMKNGNYVGRYEAWFDNGQKQVDMTLTEEGFNDGERKAWWKNGNPRSEGRYKSGKRVGEHKQWDEEGNLESVQIYSEDGDYLGFEEHGEWGIERRVTFTEDGGQEETRYARSGRVMSVERTNGKGRFNGLQEMNFIDGTPHVRANYSDGVLDGVREVYFPNGNIQARGEYKDGIREGIHEIYNRDGDLILRNEYHNDEIVRALPLDESGVMFRKAFDSANEELEGERVSVDNPDLMREYGLSNVTMTKKGDLVTLNKVVVAEKKKGNGTRFMTDLTSEADNNGWTLALTPDDSFGATSVGRLKKFYKRFGFKENKGRNADLTVNESMIRQPEAPRFRLSNREEMDREYMAAVEAGDMGTAQRMVDEAAEAAGYTIRGYHGTTHDFTIFDRSKGNAEGNWGKGFYFTNNEDDAEANYSGEGPDLANRIEHLAEQMEWMDGYEDMDYDQRVEEARKQLSGGNPHVITAAIRMENPVVFDSHYGSDETFFDYNSGYNEETDEYEDEPSGKLVDFVEAWNDVLYDFDYQNVSPDQILEYADYDGLTASQLENKAREIIDSVGGIMTLDGEYASGEFLRQVFERMGFDGIVDNNVNIKFGTQRKYGRAMEGMDYGTTHVIAFNPGQIKQTDPVTYDDEGKVIPLSKRFDTSNEDIRFRKANQTQNGFISNAEAALDRVKMDKATPEQWIKMLEKEGGMKSGEDKWLGLSDWLKASDKKTLTKDEIADFIGENRIQIEEQAYSENVDLWQMAKDDIKERIGKGRDLNELQDEINEIIESDEYIGLAGHVIDDGLIIDVMSDRYGDDFRMGYDVFDGKIDYSIDPDAIDEYEFRDKPGTRAINGTRLTYTTAGLDNKAEIALTVPTIEPWNGSDQIHFGDAGEGRAVAWIRFGDAISVETEESGEERPKEEELTPEQRARLDSLEEQVRKAGQIAQEARNQSEWDVAEAAMREAQAERDAYKEELGMNNRPARRTPSGRGSKVLVIDEIQSKRHQEGRESGYSGSPEQKKVLAQFDAAKKEYDDYLRSLWGDEYRDGAVSKKYLDSHPLTLEQETKMTELGNKARQARERYLESSSSGGTIPAAPFEKNWHELAMKRMLRYAAENGYDKIAWTTGDQQADRYNLANVIHGIRVVEAPGGNYSIITESRDGTEQETFYDVPKEKLQDYVGKELAVRIVNGENRVDAGNGKTEQIFRGLDLKVGGEGMKGFYDDILPRFMNKYGKKWGVKVGTVELQHVYDELGHPLVMHSVDVTPEMRESVMEGQVMFRKGEAKTEGGETISYESMGGLPDGSRRTSLVERTYRKTGAFSFTGKDKIESAADVAYIFKELETSATENSFIVFVKDGKPTILHTGIGTISSTTIDSAPMVAGMKDFAPDEIYMVHNHPSGRVEASQADWKELERLQKIAGETLVKGVIIDTVSGEYGIFDSEFGGTLALTDERKHDESENVPLEVLTFDKMVFSPEYREEIRGRRMTSAGEVAAYLSAHRLGEGSKIGALLVDRKGMVTGNLVFSGNHIDKDNARNFASDAADAAIRSGAEQVILFGDFDYSRGPLSDFRQALTDLSGGNVRLTDVVKVDGNHTRSLAEGTLMDSGENKKALASAVPGDESPFKATDVTSASGANILKNLESFAKDVENIGFRAKGSFLNDLGEKLGAKHEGSKSLYATFKAKNGTVFTLRLADHNATVSNFDHSGKDYGISIIISRKANKGITDDGDAHIEEFFYSDKALRKADNEPYAKIVRSVIQSLYSGEYKDKTGLAIQQSANEERVLKDSVNEYGESEVRFRKVTDPATLERLESEPTIKVYRAMQEIDGQLYPPMAAKVEGKMQEPIELGVWEEAEERPDLADVKGYFTLNKGNGKSLKARYNPYIHTSRSPLNDQFTSAYDRPNLVTVEVEVPESELTSGYKAEKAKDSVGEMVWHSGPVSSKLPENKSRKVILTRWDKPVRIVPDSEVAERIAELLEGENIAVPYNTVTPSLREELEKRGVEISDIPSGKVKPKKGSPLELDNKTLEERKAEERRFADEVKEILETRGFKWVSVSPSVTSSGVSTYINVYRNSNQDNLVKIRISDHSVTSNNRVLNEYHVRRDQTPRDVVNDIFGDQDGVLFRKSQEAVRQSQEGGIAEVIGDDNATELYLNVYRAVPKEIRDRIISRAGDSYIFSDATRDIISEAVEKGDETGIAGLASNMLRDYLGDLDERTARYILWRGTRKASDEDIIDMARDITMRRRLQVGEFAGQPMFRLSENLEENQMRADSMADDAKETLDEKKAVAKEDDALTALKAMSLQKEYDRKTVNTISVLAKNIIKDQNIETLNRREIARLLGIVTTSVGKAPKTVKRNADTLIGLIVDHLLRSEETKLGMLTSINSTKTNQTGVNVAAKLDPRGQNILKAYKAGLDMDTENPNDEFDETTIKGRLAELSEKMEDTDEAVRAEAEDEYAGLMLALEYKEQIKAKVDEERSLKTKLAEAVNEFKDGKRPRESYNQFVAETEKSIRENRIGRIEAYRELYAKVQRMISGSAEALKEFREREKNRIDEIHHLANSDMQGISASPEEESSTLASRLANSSIVRFFARPLATFDQMLRLFGQKNITGEGNLFNKFHRAWIEATERAYLGEKEAKAELDAKVSEVFDRKMRWSDLYTEERKMPNVKAKWWDSGRKEMVEHELTQGQLLYIYMVNKMTDGRMKLRRMGITQETVDAIARQMDERFIELADWLQGEYLVNLRNKYDAVHVRLFGAHMAAIEDYFPLKINKRSLNKAEDIGRPDFDDALPATTTGSIIARRRNTQDLDLLNADAFSVVIEHVEQTEKWAAFAEFNKDLNALLSYKRFRNQVQNMTSVYGSGRELWENFKAVCQIAGGAYRPAGKKSKIDTDVLNIAKGVTAAKISLRVYTAIKQFLSMPAFISDANIKYLATNLATPWKAWNWAMENLPMFEKRWKSRMAGDTRLMKTDSDWKVFQSKTYDFMSRIGMSPNAFVDAWTVAVGSHSIYQTRYDRYIKDGYTEEQADKKAKQDATTLYNETQQSNEAAFVSQVQLDRTIGSTALTVFRNSSMGYQRQLHDAIRNLGKYLKPGYKAVSIDFMTRQMMRDGLTEEQARHAAERNYNRELGRSLSRIGTFGFLVQFAWNLGGSIAYLLFGDDDDKKEEMLSEAFVHGLIGGSMEGLAGGNILSEAINMAVKGKNLNGYDPSLLPIFSDIKNTFSKMGSNPVAGWYDLICLGVQAGLGFNPQTISDAVVAVVDACGGDLDTSKEAMLLIMRVLQVPQSQVDQIYIDELGTNAAGARKMSPTEMAERYARYKINKEAGPLGWAYSDEAEEKREKAYIKSFKKKVKERNDLHKRK
ncbi:MAG: hypothetical protein IKW99_03360 [Bacteroidales bacterium]|nr:hypothetical protein [Bacteroidales bacterium]